MNANEQTYRSLLADIASLSGLSEIRGSDMTQYWCINDAPKLEKQILDAVELGHLPNLDLFPVSLQRLALRSVSDPMCMRWLRQLLLFSYKAHVQHDNSTTCESISTFIKTNNEVGDWANSLATTSPILLNLVRKHVQSVLYVFREKEIIPAHGPGATTTPKGMFSKWYSQIESIYPYSDYCSLYFNQEACSGFGECSDEDQVADLVAVPKDSRGPRLICIHPSESQWIQQGLRIQLERAIASRRSSYGPWPCGHVLFDDQLTNGSLALSSSLDGRYATLDMKEASDRVSDVLIQILFGRKYKFFGCCRAQKCHVRDALFGFPDFDIHSYAPMGNATTFPVQGLLFWAICCSSMQRHGFHQPGDAYVFGDDIIVPTEAAPFIIDDLESFGLVVNRRKSFWRGQFRESCGVDAFKGINVTPVRWRCSLNAESLSELQSLSDTAMRLRLAGYEEAAVTTYAHINKHMRRFTKRNITLTNNVEHGGIAEFSKLPASVWRDAYWHRDSQQFVSPVYRIQDSVPKSTLSGWNHVLESVCSLERTARSNVPDRTVSRRSVLDRGWIPIT